MENSGTGRRLDNDSMLRIISRQDVNSTAPEVWWWWSLRWHSSGFFAKRGSHKILNFLVLVLHTDPLSRK